MEYLQQNSHLFFPYFKEDLLRYRLSEPWWFGLIFTIDSCIERRRSLPAAIFHFCHTHFCKSHSSASHTRIERKERLHVLIELQKVENRHDPRQTRWKFESVPNSS